MSIWHTVGRSAGIQIAVSGGSGLLGIVTSRLIISHFGVAAYGQYGLLASLPALIPFADLGIAAVIVNNIAGSKHPATDDTVRRTITSAFRVMLTSGLVIAAVSLLLYVSGLWPVVLGEGLLPGGEVAATLCLIVFGLGLPLGVGSRVLVGLGRNPLQTAIQGLTAPLVFLWVLAMVAVGSAAANYLAIASYLALACVLGTMLLVASRLLRPQIGAALRDVPRVRRRPGVPVLHLAWPMLVQMIALPIAMQTGRIQLSHRGTTAELASYNLASQLFGIVLQAIYTAGVALWPYYAKARSDGERVSPAGATAVFTAGGLFMGLALTVVLPFVVKIVADGAITLDLPLVAAFVLFVTIQAAKYPLGMYMTDAKGLKFQLVPIFIMIPLTLGLSWMLIPVIGSAAPVLATCVSVLLCQVAPNIWWVRRDLAVAR
ncbi:O-antigen/teichoic acid export membrane protein [Terracoccus luteus]|uniref:O-antigen/teichoic acid export membrane protein n=1 Tax=Terracoccus luteus TaxID=53356 RepID=A0A495Y2X4_9MICO|nr:polysaccharide biosynthesis protein [Terracoccus luteus]RKT78468.1 O-antigen/teichoic acid export membrane protein [Terracoccus luteus]